MYNQNQQLSAQWRATQDRLAAIDARTQTHEQQFGKLTEREKRESQAVQAAKSLELNHGIKVDPAELREIAQTSTDPAGTWLSQNFEKVVKARMDALTKTQAKPNSPGSPRGKTFDPFDPDLNADQVQDMINKGFVPSRTSK